MYPFTIHFSQLYALQLVWKHCMYKVFAHSFCIYWSSYYVTGQCAQSSLGKSSLLLYAHMITHVLTNVGLFLSQQKVIQDWLDKTKMFGVKVTSTPLQLDAIAPVDPIVYESVISVL